MIDAMQIASALRLPCTVSGRMQNALKDWEQVYRDEGSWVKNRVRSLRIPAVTVKEIKRLTLKEFSAQVSDAELDAAFQAIIRQLRRKLDYGLAVGGMLVKPYWTAAGLCADLVTQNQYLPVNYTDDTCDCAACPETLTIGKTSYTRIELHTYNRSARTHTVENRCFRSDNPSFIGTECSLTEVPDWSAILPHKVFRNVAEPLFAVFQMPDANSIDPDSPLGISAYADALGFIRDADEHWERILWELESSERAIDASEDFFRMKDGKPVLPRGRERMYRTFQSNPNKSDNIFSTFSPAVRDTSYFHALNQILRRIENSCGLAYGFLSQVEDVEKTAEEIKSSKQRSYDRVRDIQEALRGTLEHTVYVMQYLRDYYENRTAGEATLTCTFGDGVLEDADKEFNRRMQMVSAGLLSKEQFVMWYFDCDETKAAEYLPKIEPLFGGGGNAFTI